MEKLAQQNEEGESLVSKGWCDKETYGKIFDLTFQQEAKQRLADRERNEEAGNIKFEY